VPAGKMWRVDQEAFLNLQGSADGDADGVDASAFVFSSVDNDVEIFHNFRKDIGEG